MLQNRGVTKTKNGVVLICKKGNGWTPRESKVRMREISRDQGVIKDVTPETILKILQLNYVTVTDEIKDVIDRTLG